MFHLFLQFKKHSNVLKQLRRLNKEQIKKQLLDSPFHNENITKKDVSAWVDAVDDCQEAMKLIDFLKLDKFWALIKDRWNVITMLFLLFLLLCKHLLLFTALKQVMKE